MPRRRVDGVLLLDKPGGMSSNAALQRVRRRYRAEKAGHTGTLDPLASGLLPLCFGEATKFAQGLLDAPKAYVATLAFGTATSTGDAEGEPIATGPIPASAAEIEAALPGFRGRISQVPPRHAALKHEGRSYYEYARAGVEIPRPAREVVIDALTLLDWLPPRAVLEVRCSKGTYVRTLAEDIAHALGTEAHLCALRRTASGPFSLASAVALADVEMADDATLGRWLLPIDAPLSGMPSIVLDETAVSAVTHGRRAAILADAEGCRAAYDTCGRFVGVVRIEAGSLAAVRLVRADRGEG